MQVRTTAQQRLMGIWLGMPKGDAREQFFFQFVCAPGTPEERLQAWEAARVTPDERGKQAEGAA